MKFLVFLICFFAFQCQSQTTTVLISIDGFAAHYLQQFKPKTILSLADKGVISAGLVPSFPTKTFPNHLTLVTGKAPFEHGIVLNKFYDKQADAIYSYGRDSSKNQWLKYPPIWTLLEKKDIPTAIYFWPESEKSYQNILPSFYKNYDGSVPNADRFAQMLAWLQINDETKPQLIVGYFSTVDTIGHHYGRESPKLAKAIKLLDQQLGDFIEQVASTVKSPVNFIIVSDHGMVQTGKANAILESSVIPTWISESFKIIQNGTQIFIYDKNANKKLVDKAYQALILANKKNVIKRYDVFNKNTYPISWKVIKDKSFVPDIIISALPPTTFTTDLSKVHVETHGFESKYADDLNGLFVAAGPDFKESVKLGTFSNVEVFPILTKIFSLETTSENLNKEIQQKIFKIDE